MKTKKLTNLNFDFEDRVSCLTWSPDGNYLAVGTAEGEVAIVNKKIFESEPPDTINCRWDSTYIYGAHSHPVTTLRFTSNSKAVLSASYYDSTRLWNVRGGGQIDRDCWELGNNSYLEGVISLETYGSRFACLTDYEELCVEVVDLISHDSEERLSLGVSIIPLLKGMSDDFVTFLNEELLLTCLSNKTLASKLVLRPIFSSPAECLPGLVLDHKVNSVSYSRQNNLLYTSSLTNYSPVVKAYYVREGNRPSIEPLAAIDRLVPTKEKAMYQTTKLVGTKDNLLLIGFDYRGFLEITELKPNGEVEGDSVRVEVNLKKTEISSWKHLVDVTSDGHYLAYSNQKEVTICLLTR